METLAQHWNDWGGQFTRFAGSMLVQSTVLILVIGLVDFTFRRKTRAIVRYALWMLLLVKLILPTNLALPTGIFRFQQRVAPAVREAPLVSAGEHLRFSVSIDEVRMPIQATRPVSKSIQLRPQAWVLLGWVLSLMILAGFITHRCGIVRAIIKEAGPGTPELQSIMEECRRELRIKTGVEVRVSRGPITPCLCGLIRPIVIIPSRVAESLLPSEVRAVLLHELAHFKRGDLFVNVLQTALQIFYFYNPLLWWANHRIRALREEAVDETVLVTMGREAEQYPAALVNVAKLAISNPQFTFGTIGILESRSGFGSRVRKMLSSPVPRSARLGVSGIVVVGSLAFALLPMAKTGSATNPVGDVRTTFGKNVVSVADNQPLENTAIAKVGHFSSPTLKTAESSGTNSLSMDDLFGIYQPFGEFRSRRQSIAFTELTTRSNAISFLIEKLRNNRPKPDTGSAIESREKAVYLLGKYHTRGGSAVPALLENLDDADTIRHAVIQSLGEIGEAAQGAIPALLEELKFQHSEAAHALAHIAPNSERVIRALIDAIADPSKAPDFRLQVVDALLWIRVRPELLKSAILGWSNSSDDVLRQAAKRFEPPPSNGIRGEPPWAKYTAGDVPKLIERLRSSPNDLEAINTLCFLRTNSAPALPVLTNILKTKSSQFPGSIVNAIGNIGPAAKSAIPLLIELLGEDNRPLFQNTLASLRDFGPDALAAKPILLKLIDDQDRDLRWAAAHALWRIDPSEANRCIPILLTGIDTSAASRFYQIGIIGDLGAQAVPLVPRLFELLKEDEWTRFAAARAIGKLAPERRSEVIPVLMASLEDKTLLNRHEAAHVLGDFGASAVLALPLLRKLSDDPEEWIQKMSREAVEKIETALKASN